MLVSQKPTIIHNGNQVNPTDYGQAPKSQKELDERAINARSLLDQANKLKLSRASQDKVAEAYKKADEAQQGLFLLKGGLTEKAMKEIKEDRFISFDEETGVLTLSKKNAKKLVVGEKLKSANNPDKMVEITKINALNKEQMKEFNRKVLEINKPYYVPLFNIKEEELAIQNQIDNEEKTKKIEEHKRVVEDAEARLRRIAEIKQRALEQKAKKEAEGLNSKK